jgi:RNA-directed DNA polymerase
MIKAPIKLQDLRRKIYIKAKAEKTWRFWGLFAHVAKLETLREAYKMAKRNNGAPGIDGVSFEDIESQGVDQFLEKLREELLQDTYKPMRNRKHLIPKGDGKFRTLGIPSVRDRVVQGALKLILEPVFEADFQDGSYGYRPKRTAHEAIQRVAQAVVKRKTRVIDVDLKSYFDTVRHDLLMSKIARRVDDPRTLRLVKQILNAAGSRGVPQGGVISPLLANLFLNEVDKMLEKAKEVTGKDRHTYIEYARFADDLVILVDGFRRWDWLLKGAYRRLCEELGKLDVQLNTEKSRIVDLTKDGSFSFLGFEFRQACTLQGKLSVRFAPKLKARSKLIEKLSEVFRRYNSQPIGRVIEIINPILRGWVNYFRVGNSAKCFCYIKDWVEKKVRRHLMKSRKRKGFGWDRWSKDFIYQKLGLHADYKVRYI